MRDARQLARRVLIVRLGAMGDVLHALPAVHLLREAMPKCEIGWAIESRWAPLLCAAGTPLAGERSPARPLVDTVHVVDTRAWRKSAFAPATWRSVTTSISAIRQHRYEVAIDLQGAAKSSLLAAVAGTPAVAGFREPRESIARLFYSHSVETSTPHVVDQNFALVRDVAGDAVAPPKTLLPVDPEAEAWVDAELARKDLERFAILAPTAGWSAKEWPAENFGAVARELAASGISSLINFGPGEEAVAEQVRQASGGIAIPFACDLGQLIALTRRAKLFVGGDTGPMHLAAALQVPVVALFGPTDPARNGPYSPYARVLRSPNSVTSYSHVDRRDPGLDSITPAEVLTAVHSLLS